MGHLTLSIKNCTAIRLVKILTMYLMKFCAMEPLATLISVWSLRLSKNIHSLFVMLSMDWSFNRWRFTKNYWETPISNSVLVSTVLTEKTATFLKIVLRRSAGRELVSQTTETWMMVVVSSQMLQLLFMLITLKNFVIWKMLTEKDQSEKRSPLKTVKSFNALKETRLLLEPSVAALTE